VGDLECKVLYLPKNIEEISMANAAVGILVYIWKKFGGELAVSSKETSVTKLDDEAVKFWKALLRELMCDKAPESLAFKGGNAAEKGTAAARAAYMKRFLSTIKKTHLVKFLSLLCILQRVIKN
jgi:hypothetical protein